MLQSVSSSGGMSATQLAKLFTKLDTNGDKSVSKSEFVSGKPSDVSEDQAGSLFDQLDSAGSGALSQSDLQTAFQQLTSTMQSTLIQAQGTQSGRGRGGPGGPPPDSSQMFSDLDTDGDGTVTRAEFLAGRPDDVSEEQASSFFDTIAGDNGDSLTEAQFAEGMKNAGPPQQQAASQSGSTQGPGGPPPDSSQMFSDLDTDGDGTVTRAEFLAGRPDDISEEQAAAFFDTIAGDNGDSLTETQFAEGMKNAGPPGDAPASQVTAEDATDSDTEAYLSQLLDQIMKAVSSYQMTASRYALEQQASVLGSTSVSA